MQAAALGLVVLLGTLLASTEALGEEPEQGREAITHISQDWFDVMMKGVQARRAARSPAESEQVRKEFAAQERPFVERCLALSAEHGDDWIAIAALKLVACRSPKTKEGQEAVESLSAQAASASLDALAQGLSFGTNTSMRPIRVVGPVILDRVKHAPDHPKAAKLLASVVCGISVDGHEAAQAPPEFTEAADLIVDRYADSVDIGHLCEHLGRGSGSPPCDLLLKN